MLQWKVSTLFGRSHETFTYSYDTYCVPQGGELEYVDSHTLSQITACVWNKYFGAYFKKFNQLLKIVLKDKNIFLKIIYIN